jgi:UDP-glucuronate 4-epimerase
MLKQTVDVGASTVLVTGAAGFIGSHLCDRLLATGVRVTGIDNFDPLYDRRIKERNMAGALAHPNYDFLEADILDVPRLAEVIANGRFDLIVHLAALAGVRQSIERPVKYCEVNVTGTANMLEAARQAEIRHFVSSSSSSVYGDRAEIPFRETDNVDRPFSPYAATKKAGELLCATYHSLYDLPVTCVRFFTVYGPRQRPEMAISKFARLMLRGAPVPMFGDGTMGRDFTFIDDIVDGLLAIAARPHGYQIVNLGGGRLTVLRDLIASLGAALGVEPIVERRPLQPGDVRQTLADLSRATELYGYKPAYPLEKGLRAFADWLRSDPVYSETN